MRVRFFEARFYEVDLVDGEITKSDDRTSEFESDDHEEVARWLHADRLEPVENFPAVFACPDGPEPLDYATGYQIRVVATIEGLQPTDLDKVVTHLATL